MSEIIKNTLPLPKNAELAVSFESAMDKFGHEMFIGNISLDYNCSNYETAIQVNCTFESELLCGYISEHVDPGYSWLKYMESTSNYNGPKSDHTYENSSNIQ